MASSRLSSILECKENVDENEMSHLASKTRALNLFAEPSVEIKGRKGLSGKDNMSMQTPRRALGDVKNLQQTSVQSTSKFRLPTDATECGKKQLVADSEIAISNEEEELPIERFIWEEPEPDDFADILGPMQERLSSLTSRQWNQLLPDTNKMFSSLLGVSSDDVDALLDDAERDVDRILLQGGDLCADDIVID